MTCVKVITYRVHFRELFIITIFSFPFRTYILYTQLSLLQVTSQIAEKIDHDRGNMSTQEGSGPTAEDDAVARLTLSLSCPVFVSMRIQFTYNLTWIVSCRFLNVTETVDDTFM